MWWLWLLIGFSVIYFVYIVVLFNMLVRHRNRVNNAWHRIDVELNRRADLIPNLVETVRGYAAHEKETLEAVTNARASVQSAGSVNQRAQAEGRVVSALGSLLALAERYPELKADTGFISLQVELTSTEDQIAMARQFYNDSVMTYDISRQKFPANMIASAFGFTEQRDYFEPSEPEARDRPDVLFGRSADDRVSQ